MEMILRALNMLLWILVWTSGVLVSHPTPYESLFDDRLYPDANGFVGQGLFFLILMVSCDVILIWMNQKSRGRQQGDRSATGEGSI